MCSPRLWISKLACSYLCTRLSNWRKICGLSDKTAFDFEGDSSCFDDRKELVPELAISRDSRSSTGYFPREGRFTRVRISLLERSMNTIFPYGMDLTTNSAYNIIRRGESLVQRLCLFYFVRSNLPFLYKFHFMCDTGASYTNPR